MEFTTHSAGAYTQDKKKKEMEKQNKKHLSSNVTEGLDKTSVEKLILSVFCFDFQPNFVLATAAGIL